MTFLATTLLGSQLGSQGFGHCSQQTLDGSNGEPGLDKFQVGFNSTLFPEHTFCPSSLATRGPPLPFSQPAPVLQGCPSGDLSKPLLQVLDVRRVRVPSPTLGTTLQELHFEGQLGEFKFFAFLSQLCRGSAGAVQGAGRGRPGNSQGVAVGRRQTGQEAKQAHGNCILQSQIVQHPDNLTTEPPSTL